MAKINPQDISWLAPTTNMDGSAIVEPLSYRLAVDGVDFLDFPGTLNPDGRYSESTASMGLETGVPLSITLKAFYVSSPSLISDPSAPLEIILGVAKPNPPLDLRAS